MLVIEKTNEDGLVDVIEADNYTVNIQLKTPQKVVDGMMKWFARGISKGLYGHTGYEYRREIGVLKLMNPTVYDVLNNGRAIFVDSSNDMSDGLVHGMGISGCLGVVGACNIDWSSYSGSDTFRGTMNLAESSRINGTYNFKHHIVIDFPTHACNGKFDKILFYPYSSYDHSISSDYNTFKYPRFIPKILDYVGEIRFGSKSPQYNWACSIGDGTILAKSGYVSSSASYASGGAGYYKDGEVYNVNCVQTGNSAGYWVPVNFKGKYHIYDPSTYPTNAMAFNNHYMQPIDNIDISVDPCVFTVGSRVLLSTLLPNINCTSTQNLNVYALGMFGDIIYIAYKNGSTNVSEVQFYDKDSKLIITHTVDVGVVGRHGGIFGNGMFLVIGNHLFNKQLSYLGIIEYSPVKDASGIFIHDSVGSKNYFLSNEYSQILANNVGSATQEQNTHHSVYEMELLPPAIEINLAEPLSKTNVETLKLIFDFDISIE